MEPEGSIVKGRSVRSSSKTLGRAWVEPPYITRIQTSSSYEKVRYWVVASEGKDMATQQTLNVVTLPFIT